VLDEAVATQDTVTQLVATVRRVARTVPGGQELVLAVATRSGHDYSRPGKREIAWDDAPAREQLTDGLVRDAHAVLAAVAAAVGLLGLVSGQAVEVVDDPHGPGRWRIAQRITPDRVIGTVDPQSRHAHKTTSRRQEGFKAHVVVEPETGIVTACAVTMASGEHSALAGATAGTTVIDGQVDSAAAGPGALFHLAGTPLGASITLTSASRTLRYTVQARRSYPKSRLPADIFNRTGPARLVIVTCGGSFDHTAGRYNDNIVVYATPD